MPKMGESITEGTILRWLKKEGDHVKKDEMILEISTDKVDTEVPSSVEGTLLKMLVKENETVSVGTPIASIGTDGETAGAAAPVAQAPVAQAPAAQAPAAQAPAAQSAPAQAPTPQAAPAPTPAVAAPIASATPPAQTPIAAPASNGQSEAVVMPKMGESITEGTILRWLKKEGEVVKKDESILEISTDKVDTEVPATFAGTLSQIVAKEGETVGVGATIAYIVIGSAPAAAATAASAPASVPAAPQVAQPVTQVQTQSAPASQVSQAPTPVSRASGDRFYSPLVRSIAKAEGVSQSELDTIGGTGLGGRVNKTDMLAYVGVKKSGVSANGSASGNQSLGSPASGNAAPGPLPVAQTGSATPTIAPVSYPLPAEGLYTAIPMDNIRMRIAEHMVRSKHTSAHVTSVSEVDLTNIVNFRNKFKDEFKARYGLNLTYTPIFIEAMVKAIKDFPIINSSVDGNRIIVKKEINFGVAVSLPAVEGAPLPPALIVPVIKRAENLNLSGIAKSLADLAQRARTKKLVPDDISGGTFTLTNPGMYGNLFGTPIINQPQVAIMTTGAIVKRVIVKTDPEGNDYLAIRSMMYLGLSYDHRIIDGMYGVQFTDRVRKYLEEFNETGI